MTEVVFHFGVEDKVDYAIRLVRKVARSGSRIRVALAPEELSAFSGRLWAATPTQFLAHCDEQAAPSVQRRSPVLLSAAGASDETGVPVLLNLTNDMPRDLQRYQKILEVISTDPQDRQQGRTRKRAYDSAQCPVVMHDAGATQAVGAA